MTRRPGGTARHALAALTVAGACALFATGCAPEIGGEATFPVLSRATLPNYYEPVATVDEKRCTHAILFLFVWGDNANHEALITDILTQYKGDAIADAEITFFQIPAIVYTQQCARVQGTVVRRSGAPAAPAGPGAAGAAPGTPPPPVQPAKPAGGTP